MCMHVMDIFFGVRLPQTFFARPEYTCSWCSSSRQMRLACVVVQRQLKRYARRGQIVREEGPVERAATAGRT